MGPSDEHAEPSPDKADSAGPAGPAAPEPDAPPDPAEPAAADEHFAFPDDQGFDEDYGLGGAGRSYADSRRPALLLAAALGALALAAGLFVGGMFLFADDDESDAEATATDFLSAWQDEDIEAMRALTADPPASFEQAYEDFTQGMQVEATEFEIEELLQESGEARVEFRAELTLAPVGAWSYAANLRLSRDGDGEWLVDWSPSSIHPALGQGEGQRLRLVSSWPERGRITGIDGEPLVTEQDGTLIGIEPGRLDNGDRTEVHDAFDDHLDVEADEVDAALDAPGVEPHHLVEIVTVPTEQYRDVESDLRPVPGIVFRERGLRSGPSDDFARHIVGHTGEATAERLDELGAPYQPGDIVGLSGLESRFERELAGTPSGEVQLVSTGSAEDAPDEDGSNAAADEPELVEVVETVSGRNPTDIATTLDPVVQLTVEAALDQVDGPAAAVVVDPEGNVRAAAARPLDEFNRALQGMYPPGSTFKVVTTDALLAAGLSPDDEVECPETLDVGGRVFSNFEDTELGTVPFTDAFAESCNTAFVGQAGELPDDGLTEAAERFGFNTDYSIGVSAAGGSFPVPADATEQAAASLGQGRVEASPLHMATVAAAINEGTWHPPMLLPDLPSPSSREDTEDTEDTDGSELDDDNSDEVEPQPLDAEHSTTINELMEQVVGQGSGDAAAVDGEVIAGKTGTAEFGEGDPPPTHAWFIGSRGDLSLALLLEDGGVGGEDAAPVAGAIFSALGE